MVAFLEVGLELPHNQPAISRGAVLLRIPVQRIQRSLNETGCVKRPEQQQTMLNGMSFLSGSSSSTKTVVNTSENVDYAAVLGCWHTDDGGGLA